MNTFEVLGVQRERVGYYPNSTLLHSDPVGVDLNGRTHISSIYDNSILCFEIERVDDRYDRLALVTAHNIDMETFAGKPVSVGLEPDGKTPAGVEWRRKNSRLHLRVEIVVAGQQHGRVY